MVFHSGTRAHHKNANDDDRFSRQPITNDAYHFTREPRFTSTQNHPQPAPFASSTKPPPPPPSLRTHHRTQQARTLIDLSTQNVACTVSRSRKPINCLLSKCICSFVPYLPSTIYTLCVYVVCYAAYNLKARHAPGGRSAHGKPHPSPNRTNKRLEPPR